MLINDRTINIFRNPIWCILLLIAGLLLMPQPVQAIAFAPSSPDNNDIYQNLLSDPGVKQLTRFSEIIALLQAGKIDEGRLRLAQYLTANPKDGAGLELAGLILIQKKDLANAALSFREALTIEPQRLSARAKLGVVLLFDNQKEAGERELLAVLKQKPDDAVSHLFLGWSELRGGDAASATRHFEQYFSIRPVKKLEPGHLALAALYNSADRYQEADRLLTPLVSTATDPKMVAQANLILASASIETGDVKRAATLVSNAAKTLPGDNTQIRLIQAQLARLEGKPAFSRSLLQAIIRSSPEVAATAHYELAKADFAEGRYDSAITELNNARKIVAVNDQPGLLREISAILVSNKRTDEAIKMLTASAAELPDAPLVRYLLAEAQAISGNTKDGLATLEKIIASHPDFSPSYYMAGVIQWGNGNKAEAEALFEQAVTRDPTEVRAWLALAGARDTEERRTDMRQTLDEALKANPGNPSLLYELAALDYTMGDSAAAEAGYRKVLASDTENLPAMNNLASLLADKPSSVKEALALAEKVYGLAKQEAVVQDTYGWALFRSGDIVKAQKILERSATALPEDGVANYHLGVVYLQAGNKIEAGKYLRKASSLTVPKQVREQIDAALKQID